MYGTQCIILYVWEVKLEFSVHVLHVHAIVSLRREHQLKNNGSFILQLLMVGSSQVQNVFTSQQE